MPILRLLTDRLIVWIWMVCWQSVPAKKNDWSHGIAWKPANCQANVSANQQTNNPRYSKILDLDLCDEAKLDIVGSPYSQHFPSNFEPPLHPAIGNLEIIHIELKPVTTGATLLRAPRGALGHGAPETHGIPMDFPWYHPKIADYTHCFPNVIQAIPYAQSWHNQETLDITRGMFPSAALRCSPFSADLPTRELNPRKGGKKLSHFAQPTSNFREF